MEIQSVIQNITEHSLEDETSTQFLAYIVLTIMLCSVIAFSLLLFADS